MGTSTILRLSTSKRNKIHFMRKARGMTYAAIAKVLSITVEQARDNYWDRDREITDEVIELSKPRSERTKLNEEQRQNVYDIYRGTNASYSDIAQRFKVSQGLIYSIVQKKKKEAEEAYA